MAKIIHIHYMSPTFFIDRQTNQKYLIPGWIPVSMDTTMEDVEWINPYSKPKDLSSKTSKGKEWNFESTSSPGQYYTVRIVNNEPVCNCPGAWRSKDKQCKHMKLVRKELGTSIA
jgi:hypothetical protein